jgi:D-glycero-D-manno-heptose 1,7-bisphosphate phosphatase
MCVRAAQELSLDLARSFMVGDKACDIEAGNRAGCRTILLRMAGGGWRVAGKDPFASPSTLHSPPATPDLVAGDWTEVVRYVLSNEGMRA